jgi:chemotaxis protein methyltransferase CheR
VALNSLDFDFLRRLVRDRSGIVLGEDKAYLLESRLAPVAREQGLTSIEQLCQRLRSNAPANLLRDVIEAMTTNETLWFRDVHPFEVLGRRILPELMRARAAQKQLSIWCAASSTGQEPYSVAMTIREQLPQLSSWNLRFIATDLSTEVLDRARAGIYSQLEINRGLPPDKAQRWFRRIDANSWQISDELRKMVDYRQVNLLESWPFASERFDIVMMRNVLIYFDLETKRTIMGKVKRLLPPDGWFFLGGAETTMNIDDGYERVTDERGGCYRLRSGATNRYPSGSYPAAAAPPVPIRVT